MTLGISRFTFDRSPTRNLQKESHSQQDLKLKQVITELETEWTSTRILRNIIMCNMNKVYHFVSKSGLYKFHYIGRSFCRFIRRPEHLPANWRSFIRWSPDQWLSQCYANECGRSFCCALFCVLWLVWVNVQSACALNTRYILAGVTAKILAEKARNRGSTSGRRKRLLSSP
jgi:hypothetical protein